MYLSTSSRVALAFFINTIFITVVYSLVTLTDWFNWDFTARLYLFNFGFIGISVLIIFTLFGLFYFTIPVSICCSEKPKDIQNTYVYKALERHQLLFDSQQSN